MKKKKNEENCNFPKNEKLQFSSSFFSFCFSFFFHFFFMFFHFFFIFLSCFIIFASSGAKIFQEMENYNFPRVFFIFFHFFIIFFIIFLSFLLPVVELMKNDKKWWKMIKNDKQMKKKMIKKKKMKKKLEENCNFQKNHNFPRVFFIFFHFFSFFYHFSPFLLPVVQKFCKKWKITIILEFFSFCLSFFLSCFYHFCFQWWNWWKMIKNDEKW